MIDKDLLDKLEKHKDEDVRKLVEKVKNLIKLDVYETYVSLRTQRISWDSQLTQKRIDLFNTEEKPIFEVAYKYFGDLKPLIELEEYLRSKLTSEEKTKAKGALTPLERNLLKASEENA